MADSLNTNPLLCDVETGICEMPSVEKTDAVQAVTNTQKPINVIYFTDPICSSCWGIEPALRKLKLEYGHLLDFEYRMGGLLPDWSYNSGGINKPSDVAHHWDEVSLYYDMPIDGDIWLEDPLSSSYPPSIAFKAAQLQSQEKALLFLRVVREMVFLQKRNIAKWEPIEDAAMQAGLDMNIFRKDYEGAAKAQFADDLDLARQLGVRGFPTLFFVNHTGMQEKVYGSKPYAVLETAVKKLSPSAEKKAYDNNWEKLFQQFNTLSSREFAELSGKDRATVDVYLQELHDQGKLVKSQTKNGVMWRLEE